MIAQDEVGGKMTYTEFFKCRTELMKAFCDTAKNYVQLSSAGLALPLVFTQAMFGRDVAERGFLGSENSQTLMLAWLSFLLAIGFGVAYQWLAIRKVWDTLHKDHKTAETEEEWGHRDTWWVPQFKKLNRSVLYGAMVVFFYLGAILFVVFAASTLGIR